MIILKNQHETSGGAGGEVSPFPLGDRRAAAPPVDGPDMAMPGFVPPARGYEAGRADIVGLLTRLIGPPAERPGEGGRWWVCPFHDDRNPSLCVDERNGLYKCRGCKAGGDAANFIMRLKGWQFRTAYRRLQEWNLIHRPSSMPAPAHPAGPTAATPDIPMGAATPRPDAPARKRWPKSLTPDRVNDFVIDCYRRLWSDSPRANEVLRYLRWRGLSPETIRAAHLGFFEADRHPGWWPLRSLSGLVIPWMENKAVQFIAYRNMEIIITKGSAAEKKTKATRYFQVYRAAPTVYPRPRAIREGLPLIIVEGELDAILLAQELGGLASVVTLGSASREPSSSLLEAAGRAAGVYLGLDADGAGDAASSVWPSHYERIRPPAKDWTEAKQKGNNLRDYWREVFGGIRELKERFSLATASDLYKYKQINWREAESLPWPF